MGPHRCPVGWSGLECVRSHRQTPSLHMRYGKVLTLLGQLKLDSAVSRQQDSSFSSKVHFIKQNF